MQVLRMLLIHLIAMIYESLGLRLVEPFGRITGENCTSESTFSPTVRTRSLEQTSERRKWRTDQMQ